MKAPCDEAVIRSMSAAAPCRPEVKRWILAAAVLGSSMAFLDSTVVNVALPALQTSLGATVVGVQWVVESYGLFQGALILVGGSLGDLLGRRLKWTFITRWYGFRSQNQPTDSAEETVLENGCKCFIVFPPPHKSECARIAPNISTPNGH